MNTELDTRQPLPFDQAVQQIHQLYMDIFLHAIEYPDDLAGSTERLDRMLGQAMDYFGHDIDSVTVDMVYEMLVRTGAKPNRKIPQNFHNQDKAAYNIPVDVEDLLNQIPGMIPLLLIRTVLFKFKPEIINRQLTNWIPFCALYGSKLPQIDY